MVNARAHERVRAGRFTLEQINQIEIPAAVAENTSIEYIADVFGGQLLATNLIFLGPCEDALRDYLSATPEGRIPQHPQRERELQAQGRTQGMWRGASRRRWRPRSGATSSSGPSASGGANLLLGGERKRHRPKVFVSDYLVFRYIIDTLRQKLLKDGSPKAQALWDRYEQLLPNIAESLVLRHEKK